MPQKPASKPTSSPALRQKPETPEQWAALTTAWEAACEYTPNSKDFQQIVELLWESILVWRLIENQQYPVQFTAIS